MSTRTDGTDGQNPFQAAPSAAAAPDPAAPTADGKPAPKRDDRGETLGVDATGAAPEEGGFLDRAGEFAGENKWGLGAGLGAALMVGMLATAMGGGGIMALILGLLAMMLVGSLVGNMMDKNSAATPLVDKAKDALGKGKAIEKTPGFENAIDVEEGTHVAVKNDKGQYLSGQDENGELTYSPTSQPIALRTVDKDGHVTGAITGQVAENDRVFQVTSTSTALPNGQMGPAVPNSYKTVDIGSDGAIDLASPAMNSAREPSKGEAKKYALKASEVAVAIGEDNSIAAKVGEVPAEDGSKTNYDVLAVGQVKGKQANFTHVVLKDQQTGELVKDINTGEMIAVALPDKALSKIAISENNTIAPMQGDLIKAKDAGDKVNQLRKDALTARDTARGKELGDIQKDLDAPNADKELIIQKAWEHQLEAAGISNDQKSGYEAAIMAKKVTELYKNQDFRNKSADEAALEIMATAPGANQDMVKEFAGRTHDTFSKAMVDSSSDKQAKAPSKDPADLVAALAKAGETPATERFDSREEHSRSFTPVGPGIGGGMSKV